MAQLVFKRLETKYRLTDAQHARLMDLIAGRMVEDPHGPATVRNVYLDTLSHLMIRRSLEKPLYKEKLRIRSYAPAAAGQDVFVELKKKFKGVVYKRRATLPWEEALALLQGERVPQGQIERELAWTASTYEGLRPAMFVAYDREAFFDPDDHGFRITFDRRVRARTEGLTLAGGTEGALLDDGAGRLMEVKTCGGMPLWLSGFLSNERIFKTSFSKYGAAYGALVRDAALPQLLPQPVAVPLARLVPSPGPRDVPALALQAASGNLSIAVA